MGKKQKIRNKINFLLDFVESEREEENPYIKDYLVLIVDLSKKINQPLSSRAHYLFCKKCFCLRDSDNSTYRLKKHKNNKELKKYMFISCGCCGYEKKINLSRKKEIIRPKNKRINHNNKNKTQKTLKNKLNKKETKKQE